MGWFKKIFKGSNQKLRTRSGNSHNGNSGNYPTASHDEPTADTDAGHCDESHTQEPSTYEDTSNDQGNEDIERAIAMSLLEENQVQTNIRDTGKNLTPDEEEQLARALQESMVVGNSYGTMYGGTFQMDSRICAGCNMNIGNGRFLNCLNALWHPECFRCHSCSQPISEYEEFSTSGNYCFHKACCRESRDYPKCDVCSHFIPTNPAGLVEYRSHQFWVQKYCPSHLQDDTPSCCSCEKMEPRNTIYIELIDGRKLCLECLDSAVMDTIQCQPLYLQIQEFYEGLNMKIEQEVPLLLVDRQTLNEAIGGEKNDHYHMPETRGLCLSKEQTTVKKRSKRGKLTQQCVVTGILILSGLPRLLTGSILAHEMMHAWMRLNGFQTLRQDVEEGICQVMAHMWLEAELATGSRNSNAASSSSSSRGLKKGPRSLYERKLGEFFKHMIVSDASPVYGDGFRSGVLAVNKYGLPKTLEHIQRTGRFPV